MGNGELSIPIKQAVDSELPRIPDGPEIRSNSGLVCILYALAPLQHLLDTRLAKHLTGVSIQKV